MKDEETIIQADPPVEIGAGSSGRVSISMIPSARGACGFWETEASAVLRFSDSSELETGPQRLTKDDLSKLGSLTMPDDDLLIALRHRDPGLRMETVERLSSSDLDEIEKKNILDAKLDDPSSMVRSAAVGTIAQLKYGSFGDKLLKQLQSLQDRLNNIPIEKDSDELVAELSSEASDIIEGLGVLRFSKAIDPIIQTLADPNFNLDGSVDALKDMQDSVVPKKLRRYLASLRSWADSDVDMLQLKYSYICDLLVYYEDMDSITQLSNIIMTSKSEMVPRNVLWNILHLTSEEQLVQDPFVLAFRETAMATLKNSDRNARVSAITLLVRLPGSDVTALLNVGLDDPDVRVRRSTAEMVGKLGVAALRPKLQTLLGSSGDSKDWEVIEEREAIKAALARLSPTK